MDDSGLNFSCSPTAWWEVWHQLPILGIDVVCSWPFWVRRCCLLNYPWKTGLPLRQINRTGDFREGIDNHKFALLPPIRQPRGKVTFFLKKQRKIFDQMFVLSDHCAPPSKKGGPALLWCQYATCSPTKIIIINQKRYFISFLTEFLKRETTSIIISVDENVLSKNDYPIYSKLEQSL